MSNRQYRPHTSPAPYWNGPLGALRSIGVPLSDFVLPVSLSLAAFTMMGLLIMMLV